MSQEPDWAQPAVQAKWCAEARRHVEDHLSDQQIAHGRVAEEPTWFVAPYVALWAVESKARPETVGAWAVSGDVPLDLVAAEDHEHPRDALHAIADRWLAYAADVRAGRVEGAIELEGVEDDDELARMLVNRAETLHEWAADDELWEEALGGDA